MPGASRGTTCRVVPPGSSKSCSWITVVTLGVSGPRTVARLLRRRPRLSDLPQLEREHRLHGRGRCRARSLPAEALGRRREHPHRGLRLRRRHSRVERRVERGGRRGARCRKGRRSVGSSGRRTRRSGAATRGTSPIPTDTRGRLRTILTESSTLPGGSCCRSDRESARAISHRRVGFWTCAGFGAPSQGSLWPRRLP